MSPKTTPMEPSASTQKLPPPWPAGSSGPGAFAAGTDPEASCDMKSEPEGRSGGSITLLRAARQAGALAPRRGLASGQAERAVEIGIALSRAPPAEIQRHRRPPHA